MMIKVMWFLKRAPHLSLAEFADWWLNRHAKDIAADQAPYLKRYVIDVRIEDESGLAGKPAAEPEWDGIAEQWFASEADYNAVYNRTERPTRADTLAHTSAFQRMVVREYAQDLKGEIDGAS
jgi:hypothetical protein